MNEQLGGGAEPQDGAIHATGSVGDQLRAAREAKGATLADIAAQTRVPVRLLEALERGDVAALPVGPYAAGFARSYARAVGLDEDRVTADIRALQQATSSGMAPVVDHYEPADADRVPPRALAWAAGGIAVVLIAAYLLWRSFALTPDIPAPAEGSAVAAQTAGVSAAPAAPAAAIAADAPVSIRATGEVWFGLNDANGRMPFERTLKAGETYVITPEQRALTLRTSRPQAMRLVVGTRELPQLGPDDLLVKNVALDAASLTARVNAAAQGATPVPATPGAGATTVVPGAPTGNSSPAAATATPAGR